MGFFHFGPSPAGEPGPRLQQEVQPVPGDSWYWASVEDVRARRVLGVAKVRIGPRRDHVQPGHDLQVRAELEAPVPGLAGVLEEHAARGGRYLVLH